VALQVVLSITSYRHFNSKQRAHDQHIIMQLLSNIIYYSERTAWTPERASPPKASQTG
jgi:hypothetical protein